jgi:hypothetical protein
MSKAPEYFEMPGVAGKYFLCEPYRSKMSVASCAGMFKAEKNKQNGRHPHCHGCPLGAQHAGEKPPALGLFGSRMCPRCTNPAARFVRGVCVSCINREYELDRGVNAKGSAPSRLRPLAPMALSFACEGEARTTTFPKVTGRLEAMLRVLRTHPGEVEFAWAPAVMPELPQTRLFAPVREPAA